MGTGMATGQAAGIAASLTARGAFSAAETIDRLRAAGAFLTPEQTFPVPA